MFKLACKPKGVATVFPSFIRRLRYDALREGKGLKKFTSLSEVNFADSLRLNTGEKMERNNYIA